MNLLRSHFDSSQVWTTEASTHAPTNGTIAKEVVLEDIEDSVVKDLLHVLYGGTFEDTMLKENTRLIALLSATKRFGMSLLEKLCAEALKDLLQVSGRL